MKSRKEEKKFVSFKGFLRQKKKMVQKKMHENRNSFTKSMPLCGPVTVQAVFFCPPLSSQRVSVYACRKNPEFFPKRLISMIISHSVFSERKSTP